MITNASYKKATASPRTIIQPKLMVNAPNDVYEQEADAVADRVMRMPLVSSKAQGTQGMLASSIQRKCAHCEEEKKKMPVMRKADNGGGFETSSAFSSQLSNTRGGGQAMPSETKGFMESRFGRDFSHVRVHTDGSAANMSAGIQAKAFTHGSDIYFNRGEFTPNTEGGKRLLAHELTHIVQQGETYPNLSRMIQRNSCGHDRSRGSGCGRLTGTNALGDDVEFPADRFVAESLKKKFSTGQWISQVYSPPNPTKGGKIYGLIDAMKVIANDDLTLEIAEIKSCNNGKQEFGGITGGCSLATSETDGYIAALKRISPRMAAISTGLEKIGGLHLSDCKKINKENKLKLTEVGVDLNNETDVYAWCVLNGIQNKLGRKFTKGFKSVIIRANEDGVTNEDYLALAVPMKCPNNKKGLYRLIFQVNKKGGISYRCEKTCNEQKRKEQEKELEKEISDEFEITTEAQPTKYKINDPIGEEDINETPGVEVPPTGIDTTDLAIWTTGAVAAAAGLSLAYSKAKSVAEKKLIAATVERLAAEATRRGAPEIARMLDSHNIKKLGTEAYKRSLEKAEKAVEKRLISAGERKLEEKLIQKGLKKGASTAAKNLLKKGVKAIPYISAVITIIELGKIGDAYAKGAEIKFGIDGGDVDLAGDTNIKGDKPESGPTTDAKLNDTQIEVEMTETPDVKGSVEMKADKVTIKGKIGADDTPVIVDIKVNLKNTTIIYKSTGRFKGGKVILEGALNIQDSTIEIDLPEGTVLDQSGTTITQELKGVKIKITKATVEGGQGDSATGKSTTSVGGTKDKTPDAGAKSGADTGIPKTDPDTQQADKSLSEGNKQKLKSASPAVAQLYRDYFSGKDGGLKGDDKSVTQFFEIIPPDLTEEQMKDLVSRMSSAKGKTEGEVLAALKVAIEEIKKETKGSGSVPATSASAGSSDEQAPAKTQEQIIEDLKNLAQATNFTKLDFKASNFITGSKLEDRIQGNQVTTYLYGKLKSGFVVGYITGEFSSAFDIDKLEPGKHNIEIKIISQSPIVDAKGGVHKVDFGKTIKITIIKSDKKSKK